MNEMIRKRKSIRKYDQAKLDEDVLARVREKIGDVRPLYPKVPYSIEIVDKAKGIFGVTAPHYLVFRSGEMDGYLENIGFVGQQMDLFFSASGIGSCWLGVAKPESRDASALPHVICMAFGAPAEPLHRGLSEFIRKGLSEMSEGSDPRLEAARLAPSARNAQNWFFAAADGKIHCYRKAINPISGLVMNRFSFIDMGIALCHIAEESGDFTFVRDAGAPERRGCIYMGTVGA